MTGNAQAVVELDLRRMQAMVRKDVALLREVLADDLVYTHSTARLDTKSSLIGGIEAGTAVFTAIEPSDVEARDLGDAVVLTGAARFSVVAQDRPSTFRVRFIAVYGRRGGAWQMVAWQTTRIPD